MSNPTELLNRLEAMRAALNRISETSFGWDGDCGVTSIAYDALSADDEAAHRAQPEGEAPQAAEAQVLFNGEWKPASAEAFYCMTEDKRRVVDRADATLSPLCGAQHAESGAHAAKYPPAELTWIYTHCRAIGMTCKSDSGKWEHDIALFTDNQRHRIADLEAALAAQQAAAPGSLEPVDHDLLPQVGSKILIHLARQDEWVEHTVSGYYVWPALKHQIKEGEKDAYRVFVRVKDAKGYDNARLLSEVKAIPKRAAKLDGGHEGSESNG